MRNYFTQLAKQSGLNFGERPERPAPPAPLAPPHEEKTVLVAAAEPYAEDPTPSASNAAAPSAPVNVERPFEPRAGLETVSEKSVSSEQKTIAAAAPMPIAAPPEVSGPPIEPAVEIDRPLEKNAESAASASFDRERQAQVFWREIHEWVSGAPAGAPDENDAGVQTGDVAGEPARLAKQPARPDEAQTSAAENSPEEEHFHLSIGSLNIVVEETEALAPVVRREPQPPRARRPFSRLSRNYL